MDTLAFADAINRSIQFTVHAHMAEPLQPDDRVRYWDKHTPYIIHPIWCAMTLLTETTLPELIRIDGYQALLWHDVLEDTKIEHLPDTTSLHVADLVTAMTFNSFTDERKLIWDRDKLVRLLKLYDKTSNLMDGAWMSAEKWNVYVKFTRTLAEDVTANYGMLNIVKIAHAIAIEK